MNTFVILLFIVASFVGGVLLHGVVIHEIQKMKSASLTDMSAVHSRLTSIENSIKRKIN